MVNGGEKRQNFEHTKYLFKNPENKSNQTIADNEQKYKDDNFDEIWIAAGDGQKPVGEGRVIMSGKKRTNNGAKKRTKCVNEPKP